MFRVTKLRDSVNKLRSKVMSVELIISNTHEDCLRILSGMWMISTGIVKHIPIKSILTYWFTNKQTYYYRKLVTNCVVQSFFQKILYFLGIFKNSTYFKEQNL